jgi:hypothetical protein
MPEANLFLMFTRRLNELGVAYMVSGSVAVIIYGEPRLTHDVDLIVVLDREHIARLPELFPPKEFYCPPTEVIELEVARKHAGTSSSFTTRPVSRRTCICAGEIRCTPGVWRGRGGWKWRAGVRHCAPESVIVRKLEYYRGGGSEKHLRDIRSMLLASPDAIHRAELEEQIAARGLQEAWRQVEERRN